MVKKRAQRRAAERRGAGRDARWLARAPLGVPRQHGRCDHRGPGQSRPARLAAESLRVRGRCGDGIRGEPAEPEPGWWHIYPLYADAPGRRGDEGGLATPRRYKTVAENL